MNMESALAALKDGAADVRTLFSPSERSGGGSVSSSRRARPEARTDEPRPQNG